MLFAFVFALTWLNALAEDPVCGHVTPLTPCQRVTGRPTVPTEMPGTRGAIGTENGIF